jgi:SAM-dependent methyltransferase
VLRFLERAHLLNACFTAFEGAKALTGARDEPLAAGLTLPPPRLRVRVAGTVEASWFLDSGRDTASAVRDALQRHGADLADGARLLDFGCGCGRLTRHWPSLGARAVAGSDIDSDAIAWCAEELAFGRFTHHGLAPPLPYEAASFDAVCAVSVFTHLPAELQRPWAAELRRVLAPDGLLVLTVHGDRYVDRLAPAEHEDYRAGRLVVRWASAAGRNLCSAFHPAEYVSETLAEGFELLEHVSGGMVGTPFQDLIVLRRVS